MTRRVDELAAIMDSLPATTVWLSCRTSAVARRHGGAGPTSCCWRKPTGWVLRAGQQHALVSRHWYRTCSRSNVRLTSEQFKAEEAGQ